jgi:hypothetical protein
MRRRGGIARVTGDQLRELRHAVRFSSTTYSVLAAQFGYKTEMGVLKAARRFERDHNIAATDWTPGVPEVEGAATVPELTKAQVTAPASEDALAVPGYPAALR